MPGLQEWAKPESVNTFLLFLATVCLAIVTWQLGYWTKNLVAVDLEPILDWWFESNHLTEASLHFRNSGKVPILNVEIWTSQVYPGRKVDHDLLLRTRLVQQPRNPGGRLWVIEKPLPSESVFRDLGSEMKMAADLIRQADPKGEAKPGEGNCLIIFTIRFRREVDLKRYLNTAFGVVSPATPSRKAIFIDPATYSSNDDIAMASWLAGKAPDSSV